MRPPLAVGVVHRGGASGGDAFTQRPHILGAARDAPAGGGALKSRVLARVSRRGRHAHRQQHDAPGRGTDTRWAPFTPRFTY